MKTITIKGIYGIMAILMLVFGLNKFFNFIPVTPPSDATAQQFLGTMFTSYLYVVVALAEVVGGILLLWTKTRFLGWLVLLPILFNIVTFHVAHDFIGNGIWIFPSALFGLISYYQIPAIKKFLFSGKRKV